MQEVLKLIVSQGMLLDTVVRRVLVALLACRWCYTVIRSGLMVRSPSLQIGRGWTDRIVEDLEIARGFHHIFTLAHMALEHVIVHRCRRWTSLHLGAKVELCYRRHWLR